MNTGLYDIYNGLAARVEALDVVANNLANVASTGYKQDRPFHDLLEANLNRKQSAEGSARRSPRVSAYTSFTNGDLEQTGRPLDVAIQGRGFFEVQGPDGQTYYTRDGSFTLDADGNLLTASGDRVLGDGGAISVPQGEVRVDEEGGISVDGVRSTQLRIVNFGDERFLQKVGGSRFAAVGGAAPVDVEEPGVVQGFLEKSNVNAVGEMVEMMQLMREAESLQRSLHVILNEVNRSVIRDVAQTR